MHIHVDGAALGEAAFEDGAAERVENIVLNSAFEAQAP